MMICLSVVFFVLILFGICWAFCVCGLIIFLKFGEKISHYPLDCIFLTPMSLFSPSCTPITCLIDCLNYLTERLFVFFKDFFVYVCFGFDSLLLTCLCIHWSIRYFSVFHFTSSIGFSTRPDGFVRLFLLQALQPRDAPAFLTIHSVPWITIVPLHVEEPDHSALFHSSLSRLLCYCYAFYFYKCCQPCNTFLGVLNSLLAFQKMRKTYFVSIYMFAMCSSL